MFQPCMTNTRSKFEFYQEASLSQQLAQRMPEYSDYAGSDPNLSMAIANLNVFIKQGYLNGESQGVKLLMALLHEQRKASFATSERVNEITKMGMQMPKSDIAFGVKKNAGQLTR